MNSILGCQEFPWSQICARRGENLSENLPQVLAAARRCGLESWEASLPDSRDKALHLGDLVHEHGLQMPTIYANVRLHEDDWRASVDSTLQAARWAGEAGARILVVNPEPISWGQPLDKDDVQLATQALAMQALGEGLGAQNQALAYHIHAPEMRRQAREFHHTMLNTGAEEVGLCLDTHWIYRGAGDSQAALDDVVERYKSRIISLHLRQSRGGVWTEVLEDGDVDYEPLARVLEAMGFSGPVILEQASESGTPSDMEPEAALARSAAWTRRAFALKA